jgi:hypothetical protein
MEDIRAVELIQLNPLPDPVQVSRSTDYVPFVPELEVQEPESQGSALPYESGLNLDIFA